jgi:hypothetical protein
MIGTLGVRYFFFRREEGGRGRALDAFGVRLVFFFLRASVAFSLFGRISSNGVSIRMSRSNVCRGMLGGFCIKAVWSRTFALADFAA